MGIDVLSIFIGGDFFQFILFEIQVNWKLFGIYAEYHRSYKEYKIILFFIMVTNSTDESFESLINIRTRKEEK